MKFENPVWLIITPLIVLAIAGLIAFGLRSREALLSQFAAARLLDQLTEKASLQRVLVKAGLILLAFALIGISLARPQYGVNFVERKARGLDIVFVLDSSRSMLATDLRPTRLERAKLAIIDLVERLQSDRIGLVVFAGNAFLQTPPTLDYSAFRESLNSVSPSSISRGGSNIGQALREAVKAFPEDNNFKVVVLLTDGEDLEEHAIDTAREVANDGIKVYSIGIGTPEGTYLKVRSENGTEKFIRDSKGQPVRSQLDETTLRKISQLTGGSYSRLAGQSLETLYNSVIATLPREEHKSELQETRIERYQWVLSAAVLCLVLEILIRKRKKVSAQLVTALLLLNLLTPAPSYADEINQASSDEPVEEVTPEKDSTDPRVIYNQAHKSLIEGNYAEARDLYEKVIEYSDDIELERNSLYNMAHTMNQMGEEALRAQNFESADKYWKQAEELFKSANELDPADTTSLEDAQQMATRRKALEEFIEQQKSQEQQQKDNSNNSEQKQQNSETGSSENEQNKSESPSENTSSQSNESQSSKNSSEQEQSDKQKNNSNSKSSNSGNDQDNESSQSQNSEEVSQADTDSEKTEGDSSAESTENPSEDMQQQDKKAVSDEDTSENEQREVQQKTSDGTTGSGETQESTAVIEGMSISDAQFLLDSLRNNEHLLPFTEPSSKNNDSAHNKEIRDW